MKLLHSIAGNTRTRVLLAVVDGADTIGAVAETVGVPYRTAYVHLRKLRTAGFVEWGWQERGGVRALVEVVPPWTVS